MNLKTLKMVGSRMPSAMINHLLNSMNSKMLKKIKAHKFSTPRSVRKSTFKIKKKNQQSKSFKGVSFCF